MRKLCPNYDREDGLDTVLEVPIPEEMFSSQNKNAAPRSWQNMKSWVMSKSNTERPPAAAASTIIGGNRNAEIQLLLGVAGAPLIPLPVPSDHHHHPITTRNIKDQPIEASMAKYIVQQYIAAAGGESALRAVESMCTVGKVKMVASEFYAGEGMGGGTVKVKGGGGCGRKHGGGEVGGFVLWQKRPDLWSLELVVAGCKISAGSNGHVAWRQTPWHHSHASRGPPRPLRRSLQGMDPTSTANLFSNSICIGEKTINEEDCFILKMESQSSALRARSSSNVEIMRHTVWGYFSQRTGLLVHLQDTLLIRIRSPENDGVFWETSMESSINDYRTIDGVNIAHGGRTSVSLFRFGGDGSEGHARTRMEEVWTIEEVDFNIQGLSKDCFLPPADLKIEEEVYGGDDGEIGGGSSDIMVSSTRLPSKIRMANSRVGGGGGGSRVAAVYDEDEDEDFGLGSIKE